MCNLFLRLLISLRDSDYNNWQILNSLKCSLCCNIEHIYCVQRNKTSSIPNDTECASQGKICSLNSGRGRPKERLRIQLKNKMACEQNKIKRSKLLRKWQQAQSHRQSSHNCHIIKHFEFVVGAVSYNRNIFHAWNDIMCKPARCAFSENSTL